MSTSTAAIARPAIRRQPARGATRESGRSELRLVTRPTVRRRDAGFALACALLAVLGLVGTLLANIARAEGAFEIERLRDQSTVLRAEETALISDLRQVSSPARLAQRAEGLGMVPAPARQFVRLSDGKAIGVAEAAKPPVRASVTTKKPATTKPATTKPTTQKPAASSGTTTSKE